MQHSFRERLESVIPGGAHTYSRGWDQFPSNAPDILRRGRGAYVWGSNGEKLLDYGMGLRSVIFGYADRGVSRAAQRGLALGQNLTRPSGVELDAAELFVETIHAADMVKFTKNGSSAVTAAVKLARGFTGREKILVCRQHPFFSYDDWFISSTPMKLGIPKGVAELIFAFDYGNARQLSDLLIEHKGEIAAIILEPATDVGPSSGIDSFRPSKENFLTEVEALAREHGAVFILDEMITGFRYSLHGAQSLYNVKPDLTTFGKAMGNGLPISAIGGRREIMELGAINKPGVERLFLLSSTHGPELASLSAMIHVVTRLKKSNDLSHVRQYGEELIKRLNDVSTAHGLEKNLVFYGHSASPYFKVMDDNGEISLGLRTLMAQEMVNQGVLMPWIALSSAHGDRQLAKTVNALDKAARTLKLALKSNYSDYLIGPELKPVFRKFN
jgi:glutamate-1-semialdehyde 2,1-aminomutase